MPGIAFFDVDRTVLSVNSAALWVRRELRLGNITWWTALRGAFWLGLYALGFARIEQVLIDAVATQRGGLESDLQARTLAFWNEELKALIRPGARAALAAHRARGDHVYLLTTSSSYLSEALAAELGCDGFLCNRLIVEAGRFTGTIEQPLCHGEGKLTRAAALAAKLGVDLKECWYYGDSFSDVPILAGVGKPVVVNPDVRLRRQAQARGWPVEDWLTPG